MGTYTYLRVGNFPLLKTRNEIDPTAIMLFSAVDKRIRTATPVEAARYAGESDEVIQAMAADGSEYDDQEHTVFEYAASLAVVRDRSL